MHSFMHSTSTDHMAAKEEEETSHWSSIPNHVLDLIMDRLTPLMYDYISFGSVCISWRNAFNVHKPCLLPLLMVPPSFSTFTSSFSENEQDHKKKMKKKKVRRFYSISNEKVDDRIKVKMPHHSQCRGSGHGWLIIVDDIKTFPVRLFNPSLSSLSSSSSLGNPLQGDQIILPALKDLPMKISPWDYYEYADLRKAVLSANPISNPTDYIVMAIYGGSKELAYVKPGDKAWTHIKSPAIKDSRLGHFDDVIYYQHKFFVIHCGGTVVVCDDSAEGITATVRLEPLEIEYRPTQKYLVESSEGNLLQVHRDVYIGSPKERLIYSTLGFRVFKLLLAQNHQLTKAQEIATLDPSCYKWVEVKNLCGDAIFLGQNASLSISASHYPGCKPNSIYYTDDSDFYVKNPKDAPHDIGLFNLEDSTFERYFSTDLRNNSIRPVPIWPVPIWIQPNLSKKAAAYQIMTEESKLNVVDFSNSVLNEN